MTISGRLWTISATTNKLWWWKSSTGATGILPRTRHYEATLSGDFSLAKDQANDHYAEEKCHPQQTVCRLSKMRVRAQKLRAVAGLAAR